MSSMNPAPPERPWVVQRLYKGIRSRFFFLGVNLYYLPGQPGHNIAWNVDSVTDDARYDVSGVDMDVLLCVQCDGRGTRPKMVWNAPTADQEPCRSCHGTGQHANPFAVKS